MKDQKVNAGIEQLNEEMNKNWVKVGDHIVPTMHEICTLDQLIGMQVDRANTKGTIALALSSVAIIIGIIVIGLLLR